MSIKYIFLVFILVFGLFIHKNFALEEVKNSNLFEESELLEIKINEKIIYASIADSAMERQMGLSNIKNLPKDYGMLFKFENEGIYNFWMKDTFISLDMIWIDKDKKIVHIKHRALPISYPETYTSSGKKSLYVLEVNGGYSIKNNIRVGDLVSFSF